ncbi:MAG TPA: bi-domain-containing oxidoreductase [Thermoanaerobaculia bacterium]|jgi:predicted dehydrogenase
MKAVTQNLENGRLEVQELPPPALRPAGVLVRVRRSLVSLGTERAVIELAHKGPLGKARERPDLVRKVLDKARQEGLWSTYGVVRNLMSAPIPLGYSCAGEILELGAAAGAHRVGDRVACAGLGYANHAEIDYVPRQLAVPIPEGLTYDAACFVTVGAIALHGVRLAEPTLGDRVVVIGLGLVGQLCAQLARCSGATVIASDLEPEKVELARRLGAHHLAAPEALERAVADLTGGLGADAVILCAATKSSRPLAQAAAISRLRGRVVVVGDVGMEIERRPFFDKELALVVSRSYGPGRYDPDYELHGRDYPAAYVRWTEGRNLGAFLELLARGAVDVGPLISHRFAIDEAESAYAIVTGERPEPAIGIVLEYGGEAPPARRVSLPPRRAVAARPQVRCGVLGAGQFARGVLLPALAAQRDARIRAVCTASGHTGRHVAERYGAEYCTGDVAEILADPDIDAVVVATRHDSHARLATAALRAGKAVFVEKPLALTEEELGDVERALAESADARLLVGFNRRFAPLAVECRRFFADVTAPLFVSCRVNAGELPADSWVLDPEVGGGRIRGEVCHFVDTVAFLAGALPVRVAAEAIGRDPRRSQNVTVTLRLADGSVGVIHYLASGDPSLPKELVEVFGGGRVARLDNFRSLALHRDNGRQRRRRLNQAKGHAQEMAAFVGAVARGEPMPVALESILTVTRATLRIQESLERGQPLDVAAASAGAAGG